MLWQAILNDPNANLVGRSGQGQSGVDIVGSRNGDSSLTVGIQCKLKGADIKLAKREVLDELKKAPTFKPALLEYFIVTTAPDDAKLQELARLLVEEQKSKGRDLKINIWGWKTLENKIGDCILDVGSSNVR